MTTKVSQYQQLKQRHYDEGFRAGVEHERNRTTCEHTETLTLMTQHFKGKMYPTYLPWTSKSCNAKVPKRFCPDCGGLIIEKTEAPK